jgi:diguanylate cyclase
MADNDVVHQLEEWKQKYYQSITDLEKQQSYDELLQRSLARLALAAQGLDSRLDTQLTSLRKELRSKKNQFEIEKILEQMENAIAGMEVKEKNKGQTTGEILAELISSLKLARAFKPQAKTLSKQLTSAPNDTIATFLPEVSLLLESYINQYSSKKSSRGLGYHLFGIGKSSETSEPINSEQDSAEAIGALHEDDGVSPNEMPTHLVLMQLLERLSLPSDLSKKATTIRHQIETGVDDKQLPQIINDIADIVSDLGSQVITEKQDYEDFLKTLTSRLKELDEHIRETSDEDVKAFEQRHEISQVVENEFRGIRNHVEEAHDIEQLKSTVSERLDFLNQHFENYRQSDHDRFEQSQKQIKDLNDRLQTMEQESLELRQSAEKSRDLALKDALTGIWNRQALNELLEKEYSRWQRYQKPLSVVVWDIDFFKRVNDSYGHAAGDKVLKTIARIFQQQTRNTDFIARYGGEEFMGIFPETDLNDALVLANKIRDKVEHSKFHYENKPVPITASAGLASFRGNDTIDDVFKRADKALYQAKESGRNRCLVEE